MAGVYFCQTYVLYCCGRFGYCMYYQGNRTCEVSARGRLIVTQIIQFSRVNRLIFQDGDIAWNPTNVRARGTRDEALYNTLAKEALVQQDNLDELVLQNYQDSVAWFKRFIKWYGLPKFVSLSKDVFEQACQPEVNFLHYWVVVLPKFSEQIISIRKKYPYQQKFGSVKAY